MTMMMVMLFSITYVRFCVYDAVGFFLTIVSHSHSLFLCVYVCVFSSEREYL